VEFYTWLGFLHKLCVHRRSRVDLHTQRNYSRFRKGTPAKGTIPTEKSDTIIILVAISDARVIDISLRKLKTVSTSRKRKVNGKAVDTVNGPNGYQSKTLVGVSIECDGCIE
jgi:hypothetical protein